MSIYFLCSAILAFLVYRDARNKWGYSANYALLWGLGTLAAPYVVGVIYFFLGRKPQWKIPKRSDPSDSVSYSTKGDAVDVSEKISCPMCANLVPSSFEKCPSCGYTLHLHCTNCGRELDRSDKYCPGCGSKAPEK